MLGLIRHSYTYLDSQSLLKLYTSLVRPTLEYANAAWIPSFPETRPNPTTSTRECSPTSEQRSWYQSYETETMRTSYGHWNYRAYTTEEQVVTWSRPTNSHTASTKPSWSHYSVRLTPQQEATLTSSRKNAVIRGLEPISFVTPSPTDGTICVMMLSLSRA